MQRILSAVTGKAAEVTAAEGAATFKPVLMKSEHVARAYRLFRDAFVFTDRRLIFKIVHGVTGTKVEWHSLPYWAISHFSITTAGLSNQGAVLEIYLSGNDKPTISKTFSGRLDIHDVGRVLADYICAQP